MFIMQPPKTLICFNGFMNFQRSNQIIEAEKLKIVNSRIYISVNNDRLFSNVKRAYLSNSLLKDSVFKLFSD